MSPSLSFSVCVCVQPHESTRARQLRYLFFALLSGSTTNRSTPKFDAPKHETVEHPTVTQRHTYMQTHAHRHTHADIPTHAHPRRHTHTDTHTHTDKVSEVMACTSILHRRSTQWRLPRPRHNNPKQCASSPYCKIRRRLSDNSARLRTPCSVRAVEEGYVRKRRRWDMEDAEEGVFVCPKEHAVAMCKNMELEPRDIPTRRRSSLASFTPSVSDTCSWASPSRVSGKERCWHASKRR